MIERIAYDDDAKSLWVWFRQTGKYVYYGVPAAIFEALCNAASVGAVFNDQIRGRFRCQRDPARRRFGPGAGGDS